MLENSPLDWISQTLALVTFAGLVAAAMVDRAIKIQLFFESTGIPLVKAPLLLPGGYKLPVHTSKEVLRLHARLLFLATLTFAAMTGVGFDGPHTTHNLTFAWLCAAASALFLGKLAFHIWKHRTRR